MITRRDFLKSAGAATLAVAAAGILAGCSDSSSSNNSNPAPTPTPDPDPVKPTGNVFTLDEGVTLTILGTERANVLPNGTKQYLAVKIKLDNTTNKNVKVVDHNFKGKLNGADNKGWNFPIESDSTCKTCKAKLSDSQKKFMLETVDAPYISYYAEEFGRPFGAAGTNLEAAICYMTDTTATKLELYITYGSKVFNTTLDI